MQPRARASAIARSRVRARGTATVETLVMTPVIVLLGAMSFWAHGLYDTKLGAMRAAREAVVTQASFGCGESGKTSFDVTARSGTRDPSKPGAPAPPDRVPGADLAAVDRHVPGGPGTDRIGRSFASRGAHVTKTVLANGFVGAPSTPIGANVGMTCNEAVEDGDSQGMKKTSANSFDPRSP